MTCDICGGSKRVTLPTRPGDVSEDFDYVGFGMGTSGSMGAPSCKTFDCPQCAMVPYRRVRATKVTTAYPAEEYGRFQMPIERALAARFGEYLLREGLIRFTTRGARDLGLMEDKISITAHLGVVASRDVERAGAVPEVATTAAPRVPDKVRRRAKLPSGSVQWQPKVTSWSADEPVTDEFDEPMDAIANRFSGLEL
jgi:hypothetical protein